MSGGSTLICFDLKGGKKKAFGFQNALDVMKISNNLGDAKSLITHPATTTHKNLTDEARAELGIGGGHAAAVGRAGGRRRPDRGHRRGAGPGALSLHLPLGGSASDSEPGGGVAAVRFALRP